ncbi:ATP-binding protein [Streptomyces sp. NPDC050161]|uniref:ATP-binding protein n=1 Tax=Streptomyces sp. NPDC050161 TaxID=3365604 RepID=UPI0037AEB8FD
MRHCAALGRFPVQSIGEFIPWRGAKEVSGVALVVAQEVPTSSIMAVPHGAVGVGMARRRMSEELLASGVQDTVVDDAVLILSELLSNAARHARPVYEKSLPDSVREAGAVREIHGGRDQEYVLASWRIDGRGQLTVSVTDGGGPTRPRPATPSVTARGGRGLAIIRSLSKDWGVREVMEGEVTVWAVLSAYDGFADRVALAPVLPASFAAGGAQGLPPELAFADLEDPV